VNRPTSPRRRPVATYARLVADADIGDFGAPPDAAPPPRHHRPWGWIVACVLLLLVAAGLAVWALGLQGDLDDQRDQTAQAQQQADQAGKDVEALASEVDQISQSVSDAGDQLSQAGADAEKNTQAALDGLGTQVESLKGKVKKAAEDADASEDSSAP
jgi:peptidoglycan hydrolase CwlO-like protein